jgi:hypothetical protein
MSDDKPQRGYLPTVQDGTVDVVFARWAGTFGAEGLDDIRGPWTLTEEGGLFPPLAATRRYAHRLPLQEIFDAIRVTRARFSRPTFDAGRYFLGVCKTKDELRLQAEAEIAMRKVWADGFAAGVRAKDVLSAEGEPPAPPVPEEVTAES